jgi:hypothetical protein
MGQHDQKSLDNTCFSKATQGVRGFQKNFLIRRI